MHANPFPTSYYIASQPLELVHIDLKGPIHITSIGCDTSYWSMYWYDDHPDSHVELDSEEIIHLLCKYLLQSPYAETCTMPSKTSEKTKALSSFPMILSFFIGTMDTEGVQYSHEQATSDGDAERQTELHLAMYHCLLDRSQSYQYQFWFHVSLPDSCSQQISARVLLSLGSTPLSLHKRN